MMATAVGVDFFVDASDVYRVLKTLQELKRHLAKPTHQVLALLKKRMRTYPPPPAGSTYVRTFRLQNSWHFRTQISGNMLGWVKSTGLDYNLFVQEDEHQAAIHQGRWQTIQSVVAEEEQAVADIYDDFLSELLS